MSILAAKQTNEHQKSKEEIEMLTTKMICLGNVTASRHKLAVVISWPPSPNFEIATNLKADCNRKWSIIITFMLFIRSKHCTKTCLFGPIKLVAANLCLEAVK